MVRLSSTRAIALGCAAVLLGLPQTAAQAQQAPKVAVEQPVVTMDQTPIFKVVVVSRTVKTINYRHRSGATKVNFEGTSLMPGSKGEAKVESKKGYIEIEVEFGGLADAATKLGRENLTYVLWAISPEGRASNLGELLLNDSGRAKVNVTTELQAFGMIVTAEPYFAVTQPSNAVVMENIVRADTLGRVEDMSATFELLERGQYPFRENETVLKPGMDRRKTPLEVWEARNAVQISGWTGAGKYAPEQQGKAETLLAQAEDYLKRKQTKPAQMVARQAVQTAEDSRLVTVKRIEAEKLENERRAAAEREAAERSARAAAEKAAEAQRLARAEAERNARAEADRAAEAQRRAREEQERAARAEVERQAAQRATLEAEAQQRLASERAGKAEQERAAALAAKQESDAARAAALAAKQESEAAYQAALAAKKEAEAARAAALDQQNALAAEAEKAKAAAAEALRLREAAEKDRENLRQRLLTQLNTILQTTDSARGLIVNMSDVLFDTAQFTLRPTAREKLARVSGIVAAHPGLKLQIEGHTDSVGGDAYNQTLSERRAGSVRDYLVSQGLPGAEVGSTGFGKTRPVADNNTAAGRQRNRRVEIIVSGDLIDKKVSDARTQIN